MSRDNAMDRWVKISSDAFIAHVVVDGPSEDCAANEILLRASNRAEATKRLHELGYHSVRFKGNHRQPLDTDIEQIQDSPEETLWRPFGAKDPWRPLPVALQWGH